MAASVERPSVIPTTEFCLITDGYINRPVEDDGRPVPPMQNQTFMIKLNLFFILEILKYSFTLFNSFCMKFNQYLESCFLNVQFSLVLRLLLLEAGDIESNPGPNPEHTLSVLHLNIRSIRNKIDYLKDNFIDFEVLCFSETHLDLTVSTETLSISNCFINPYRKDRNMHGTKRFSDS